MYGEALDGVALTDDSAYSLLYPSGGNVTGDAVSSMLEQRLAQKTVRMRSTLM